MVNFWVFGIIDEIKNLECQSKCWFSLLFDDMIDKQFSINLRYVCEHVGLLFFQRYHGQANIAATETFKLLEKKKLLEI